MKILLVIPAYNEEENILKTYESIIDYNKKNQTNYDVIVINDGSKDNTEKVLCENNIPHVKLIQNLGIGGAVQTGYKYAYLNDYDIAIQYDGDGQHDVSYVKTVINPIINGKYNMVIGSRFKTEEDDNFKSSFMRRVGINILSFIIKSKTGVKIYDTTSGFRAIDREIITLFKDKYPTEYPEPISTVDVLKQGYKVTEVPVKMKAREKGKSSITPLKSAYYMINVVLSILVMKVVKK